MASRANGTTTTTTTQARKPAPRATTAVAARPRPIPRDIKAAAATMAVLGDPHRLGILGTMVGAGPITLDAIMGWSGLDADAATAALGLLRKRGFLTATREPGKGGWRYAVSDAGAKAWTLTHGFVD